ncbi:hypothetical protein D3C86_2250750 [compost metagenome]
MQTLVEALQVFAQQLFGGGFAVGRAGKGLDVVFNFVAGIGFGVFGRMRDGADQCQSQEE